MKRWIVILMLALCVIGCESTHRYTYYEVVHSARDLKLGDTVKIETLDNVSIKGSVVRVNDPELVVTNETEERRRIQWADIRTIERIMQKKVIE